MKEEDPGVLYVVATPIGNLDDMTSRAVEVMRSVDVVLTEDTRSFGKLKKRFAIDTRAESYHNFSEKGKTPALIERLCGGQSIALISEAGTPTVSDPGYRLIKACRDKGIPVSPVPGACAAVAALSVSGLPSDRFVFEGFLPTKKKKRTEMLAAAVESGVTTIFYESPFRIVKSLEILRDLAPDSKVFVGRELTKLYEECLSGTADEVYQNLVQRSSIKGEFVLILNNK